MRDVIVRMPDKVANVIEELREESTGVSSKTFFNRILVVAIIQFLVLIETNKDVAGEIILEFSKDINWEE